MTKKKSSLQDTSFPILQQFLGYLGTIKGKSSRTVDEYYLDLRTFFRFFKMDQNLVQPSDVIFSDISIDDITLEQISSVTLSDVYRYMNFLQMERKNGAAARARKVSSLRTFFKYLTVTTGLLKENPILQLETPKIKKSLPKYLTLDQSKQLLEEPSGNFRERDFCIITLFLNCGIRLSDLVGINISDIHRTGDDRSMRVVGKGNKERVVYLNDACLQAVEAYLQVRPRNLKRDRDALFISKQNKRISNKTVQFLVKKYLREAGLEQYSTHKLRHTAATLMYQYGHVDVRVLKEILGHENLATTEIYTHLSNKQMQEAIESNPLAEISPKHGFNMTEESSK